MLGRLVCWLTLVLAPPLASCSSWYRLHLEPPPVPVQVEPGPRLPMQVAVVSSAQYLANETGSRGSRFYGKLPENWILDLTGRLEQAGLFENVTAPKFPHAPATGILAIRYYDPEQEFSSGEMLEMWVSLLTLFLATPLFTYESELHVKGDATLFDGTRLVRSWSATARARVEYKFGADHVEMEGLLVGELNRQLVERMVLDRGILAEEMKAR